MTWLQFRRGRLVIAGIYLALALAYGVVNPAFESPDELLHFDYVETLLRTRRLPIAATQLSEYHQPPLYYAAGALITAWLPPGPPAASTVEANPFWAWRIGEVGVDNKSQFVHGPEQAFPYAGLWLRLHLLRLFSTLLGLVAVWLTGDLALLLWPNRYTIALLGTAYIAFLPQFLHLASSTSNDVPAVTFGALTLVAVGRFLDAPRLRSAAAVGIVLGAGILVKMNLLLIWALASAICGGYVLVRGWPWRRVVVSLAGLAAPPLLIAGPFLWRNWQVYGDLTALSRMDAIWGRRQSPLTLASVPHDVHNIWTSFWARFGYGQIPLPNRVYDVCLALTVVALLGIGLASVRWVSAWRRRPNDQGHPTPGAGETAGLFPGMFKTALHDISPSGFLLLYALLSIGLFVAATLCYAQTSYAGDLGRFIFPALPAIAVLLARGWDEGLELWKAQRRRVGLGVTITAGAACAFSVWALIGILRPAYVMPTLPPLPAHTLNQQPGMRLGDVAILRRVIVSDPILRPGADVTVEVEWLPLRRTATPLTFIARLRGPNQVSVGERHSYPGLGRTSTTFWEPGRPFVDRYRVPVEAAIATRIMPAEVWLEIGLYDQQADRSLPVTDWPCGREINPPLMLQLQLPMAGAPPPTASHAPLAHLGASLELTGVRLPAQARAGTELPIELDWNILGSLECQYKLFIHLIRPEQLTPVAQADGFIMGDRAPSTMWTRGQTLVDRHELQIPGDLQPGRYQLLTGIYNSKSAGERLPVRTASQAGITDSVVLGEVEVTR